MYSLAERTEQAYTILPWKALRYVAICVPGTPGGPQPGHGKRLTHWVLWCRLEELLDKAFRWATPSHALLRSEQTGCFVRFCFIHNPFCLQLSKLPLWAFTSSLGKGGVALFKPWRLATAQACGQGWNGSLGHTAASRNQAEWGAWRPGWHPHVWGCSGHWEDGQPAGTPRPAGLGWLKPALWRTLPLTSASSKPTCQELAVLAVCPQVLVVFIDKRLKEDQFHLIRLTPRAIRTMWALTDDILTCSCRQAEERTTASPSRLCFITLIAGKLFRNVEPESSLLQIKLNSCWPFPNSHREQF